MSITPILDPEFTASIEAQGRLEERFLDVMRENDTCAKKLLDALEAATKNVEPEITSAAARGFIVSIQRPRSPEFKTAQKASFSFPMEGFIQKVLMPCYESAFETYGEDAIAFARAHEIKLMQGMYI